MNFTTNMPLQDSILMGVGKLHLHGWGAVSEFSGFSKMLPS